MSQTPPPTPQSNSGDLSGIITDIADHIPTTSQEFHNPQTYRYLTKRLVSLALTVSISILIMYVANYTL